MVKVFENDLGTLQVTFLDVETLICGYKQNTRQIWAYEPGKNRYSGASNGGSNFEIQPLGAILAKF